MKIKAIEEQSYFNENMMPITTGKVYETEDELGGTVEVVGDDGENHVMLLPGEFEVVE